VPDIELYDNEGNVEDTYPVYANSHYGALYNWYAVTDVRNIAALGWHAPLAADYDILIAFLGGAAVAGGKLKEMGTVYWNVPNTGATNEVGFNARGCGTRASADGSFYGLRIEDYTWCSDPLHGAQMLGDTRGIVFNQITISVTGHSYPYYGESLRLVRNSTPLIHGQTGTYTGNDGKVYNTICIGTQEWMSEILKETKYRNGDDIPIIESNSAWIALTTGASCAYNNDYSNL
jgi:uncharacterized protein (TIGR02145 family)